MLDDDDKIYEENGPLRYVDIHTDEELLKIYHKKLKTLRSLYLEQYADFERDLKSKRRKFLIANNRIAMSINNEKYCVVKDLNSFTEIDHLVSHNIISQDNQQPCQTKNEFCQEKCLPLTKFCLKHILDDNHQLLYKKCSFNEFCGRMALNLSQEQGCFIHPKIDLSTFELLEKYNGT